jgi:hypothetical protein
MLLQKARTLYFWTLRIKRENPEGEHMHSEGELHASELENDLAENIAFFRRARCRYQSKMTTLLLP